MRYLIMEQQTVTSFGALVVSAEGLREWLEEARRDLTRQIKALKRKPWLPSAPGRGGMVE